MNRYAFNVLILMTMLLSASFAQRNYDPESVTVTRWLDTSTRPITYEEYIQSRDFAQTPNIQLLRSATITTDEIIDVFVNEELYPQIEASLDTFLLDLQIDGYGINLYIAAETQSPVSLREILYNDWNSQDITGVIFIGDLAVPWYEMYEPPDWGGQHVEFPCDLYFMDLDGNWDDTDFDGMFDRHTGQLYSDIWAGRLVASPMVYYGGTEVSILENYFRKNHDYRHGDFRLDDHALAFIDNDWNMHGWGFDVALAYPNTDSLIDIYETSRSNYINYVGGNSDNRYEHVLICSHSSPFAHYIYYNNDSYQLFHNHEIEQYMMQAISFNLFACSNARYVEFDNMGGWYIFETNYGLISIGSTKTGAMLCFDDFYWPLGEGASFGDAFLYWTQYNIETCAGEQSRPWFYGMCLQGDPTLRLARHQEPLSYCFYMPGDINGDSTVNIVDVTYAIRYFKEIGEPPPDSCYDDSTSSWLYVSGDVNGSCEFLGSDISYLISYFRAANDTLMNCPRFPVLGR